MNNYLLTDMDLSELGIRLENNLKKYGSYPAMESAKQTITSFIKKKKI